MTSDFDLGYDELKPFAEQHRVMRIPRCCGTCKWFAREYSDHACTNPAQDSYLFEPADYYSACGPGIRVDEGYLCDLWQKGGAE